MDLQLLIVYPGSGPTFYPELAHRLFIAGKERLRETALCSSRELRNMTTEQLRSAILIVVNPVECAAMSNDRLEFCSKLALGYRRIMVLAETVGSAVYKPKSRLPVTFDAVFDIGFESRKDERFFTSVPHHFVFNGPTKVEEQVITKVSPSQGRHIPWAVVGPHDLTNCKLVAELTNYGLYPGGVCFLQPPSLQGKKGEGLLSPSGLATILSKTSFCIWSSEDSCAYYESFRFIQALLAGAVPCKIDVDHSREKSGIPGIFSSVQSLYTSLQEEDHWSMFCSAREFFMSKGPLAEHLEKALRLV